MSVCLYPHLCVICLDWAPFFHTPLLLKHLHSPALTTASCALPWTFISAHLLLPVWQETVGQLTSWRSSPATPKYTVSCGNMRLLWTQNPSFPLFPFHFAGSARHQRTLGSNTQPSVRGWSGHCRHRILQGHDLFSAAHSFKVWPSTHKAFSRNAILQHVRMCNPVERMIVCPGVQLNVFISEERFCSSDFL